jgi:hemolysin activation/secretion protein
VSWIGWVAVGLAAWLAVATLVGVVLGRMFRHRELQAPVDRGVPVPAPRTNGRPPEGRPPAAS